MDLVITFDCQNSDFSFCWDTLIQTILGKRLIKTKRKYFPGSSTMMLQYGISGSFWYKIFSNIYSGFEYFFRSWIFSGTSWAAESTWSVLPSCLFASSRGLRVLRPSLLSSERGACTCHNNSDIDKSVWKGNLACLTTFLYLKKLLGDVFGQVQQRGALCFSGLLLLHKLRHLRRTSCGCHWRH